MEKRRRKNAGCYASIKLGVFFFFNRCFLVCISSSSVVGLSVKSLPNGYEMWEKLCWFDAGIFRLGRPQRGYACPFIVTPMIVWAGIRGRLHHAWICWEDVCVWRDNVRLVAPIPDSVPKVSLGVKIWAHGISWTSAGNDCDAVLSRGFRTDISFVHCTAHWPLAIIPCPRSIWPFWGDLHYNHPVFQYQYRQPGQYHTSCASAFSRKHIRRGCNY